MTGTVADVHAREDFVHAAAALGGGNLQVRKGQLHVLEHVQFVYQIKALEHEAYLSLPHLRAVFLPEAAYLHAVQVIAAGGRLVQQAHNVEQRRFSAAGGAHDGYKLVFLYFQTDVVQCQGFYFCRTEYFRKVFYLYHIFMELMELEL